MARARASIGISLLFSLLIILMPAASAIPAWVISGSYKVLEITLEEHEKQVESEDGLFLGNKYTNSEFLEPHVVKIKDQEFHIGNSYDKEALSGGFFGSITGMSDGDNTYNKRTYIPQAKLYGFSAEIDANVDGSDCVELLKNNNEDNDLESNHKIETHHLLHAASLPKGGPERIGEDRLYGGYISAQIEGGAWIGCTADSFDLSDSSGEIKIEPSDSGIYNQACENNTEREPGTDARNSMLNNHIRVLCAETYTVVHQDSTAWPSEDGATGVDDIDSYPQTGLLGGCVATDGAVDYLLGGVNIRGEFHENLTIFDRVSGNATPVELPNPVSSVGASCFISNNQLILVGGYDICPHYEELHTHMIKSGGGTETVKNYPLKNEVRGPTFGGGCLAFISEGYQSQRSIQKHPYSDDEDYNPAYSFPDSITAFACASSYSINLSTFEVAVLEHSNEMLNCAAFSTDLILNATTLLRFGGFNPQGSTLDGVQKIEPPGENSTLLNVSVVAEMTIPRISPVVEYVDGTITVMCGGAFEKNSGYQCNIIDVFTENTSSPIQVTYTEEEDTPGFSLLVALSGIFAAASVISSRREQNQNDLKAQRAVSRHELK